MADEQSRYSRLAQITKLINTNLELSEALEHVVTAISEEIVQCDSVGIYLPQGDGTFRGYVGKPETIAGMTLDMHVIDPEQDPLAKEVIDTNETIYIPDTSQDDRPDKRAIEAFKISSLLVAPLSYEDELYGLAFLFDYGIPMNLTPDEIESIQAYINMAAVAIRNANDLTRKEALIADKQLLLDVTRQLSLCSSIKEALDCCFHYLGRVLKNDNAAAHFLDPIAEKQIKPTSLSEHSDWNEEKWKETHAALQVNFKDDPLYQEVIYNKQSIMIPDVTVDPRANQEACKFFEIKGLYILPLIAVGEVLGTISIANLDQEGYIYPANAIQLAESIVDATAPVLFNLIYMEKQELIIQDRTSELREKNDELVKAIRELRQISREKDLILNSAGEGIFGMNLNGEITFSNPSATQMLGYDDENELVGLSFRKIFNWDQSENQTFSLECEESHRRSEQILSRGNGDKFPAECVITPQREEDTVVGYVVTFKDITSRKQMEEKIKYHAYYDSVTNIPNRMLFQDRLNQALTYASLQESSVAVLYLDLDRFKKINDTFGHTFGDSILRMVASRLQEAIPTEATVSRQGGDEFIILLPSVENVEEVETITKEIMKIFHAPFVVQGQEMAVKTSIGISIYPDHGTSAEVLVKHADVAMYKAKDLSGNQFQLYNSSLEDYSIENIQLENDLFKALNHDDEFILYYQPKLDLRTTSIIGFEALIRWNHPKLGMLSPKQFIPLAEETGLIIDLGQWVIRESCKQMKKWYDLGYTDVAVSANLSPQQFNQEDLVEMVSQILKETQLPPENLELELTENLIIYNTKKTLRTIQELKELGIKISIDDFGTGYSSLGYLKDFPVDTLKIDKTFIDDITTNSNNAAITNTIITLARSLNLNVIAEGVESKEQADYLNKHDCHLIQGYFFSPPLSVPTIQEKFLNV
ncbi:EAL domain-containing protein [Halobacillus fulvus]|nr:EAL domain-containing protein [Halobacillus fulvus]